MDNSNGWLNLIMFIAYLFFAVFILLSIFLTILGEHQEYVRAELANEREAGRDGPAIEGGFHVPSQVSLARTLIEAWLAEE